jgi:hypothetical protein
VASKSFGMSVSALIGDRCNADSGLRARIDPCQASREWIAHCAAVPQWLSSEQRSAEPGPSEAAEAVPAPRYAEIPRRSAPRNDKGGQAAAMHHESGLRDCLTDLLCHAVARLK